MRVAVFCSCSEKISPTFLAEAELVGQILAEAGHTVVYGGADAGCMGAVARGALSRGGRLVGVIPEMDFMEGLVQDGLTERHVVHDLSSRKTVMIDQSDAFLVFPGGFGTLDEALEVMALRSLGTLRKPLVFYNYLGVWSPFLESLEILVQQRLIRQPLDEILQVLDKPEQLREHFR
jgi:uncharacterized protein (TIGR00730 family)